MTAWEDIGSKPAPTDFDRWYAAYPRKVARGAAEKAFTKARKLASLDDLIAGAERYAQQVRGVEVRFIAHPATWLNQKRWLDERPITGLSSALSALQRAEAEHYALRRVELLVTKGIRSGSLDPQDIRLALRLGKITPEQARYHGFGHLVQQ